MKNLFVIVFIAVLTATSFAQIGSHYGGAGNQYGYRIRNTNDGGFIVAGSTDIDGTQQGKYWVMRFDSKGKPMWDSAYGRSGNNFLWSVEPTRDNGALISGYSGDQNSGNEEALMYKLDSVGRVVKKLEVDYAMGDHAHWFKQLSNGDYYWTGHTDSKGDPRGDMIMQKLDSNFKLIWEKTYDDGSYEHSHVAALTKDDGCILLGHTSSSAGREKFFAVRVDTAVTVIWKKDFGSDAANNDSPYDVTYTREGNYAFFGYSGDYSTVSSMWLLVVDTNGTIVINKHYNIDVSFVYGGIQSSDSGYVLSGYSQKPGAMTHLYVVKTDKKGNLKWQKTFGDSTAGYSVIQRKSQFIVAGETYQTPDGTDDLWLVVLDSLGNVTTLDTGKTIVIDTSVTLALSDLKLNGNSHLTNIGNDQSISITWARKGNSKSPLDVNYSLDSGTTWTKIGSVTSDINSSMWTSTPKTGYYPHARINVVATDKPFTTLSSDVFMIGTDGAVIGATSSDALSFSVYPNPVQTSTVISFTLNSDERVELALFNELGDKVATIIDRTEGAGSHYLRYTPKGLAAGSYRCELTTPRGSATHQVIIGQ
ncbi:MAG: T9SS type A sorting domain-containing protein [bacterium]